MNVPAALIKVEVETSLHCSSHRSILHHSWRYWASLKSRRAATFAIRHCQSPSLGSSMSPWSSFIASSKLQLQFTHCTSATAIILYYRHECRHTQFCIWLQIIKFYFPFMETNWRLIGLNLDCDGTRQTV